MIIQKVSSQSTNTVLPPSSFIALTVATKVFAAVITSSPGFKLTAFKDNFNASVPELTPIAYFAPINLAKFFQKPVEAFLK